MTTRYCQSLAATVVEYCTNCSLATPIATVVPIIGNSNKKLRGFSPQGYEQIITRREISDMNNRGLHS